MKSFLLSFLIVWIISPENCYSSSFRSNHEGLAIAEAMAKSEINHFPDPWTVDYNSKIVWNYTQGLIADAMMRLWAEKNDETYLKYAQAYADKLIDPDGKIIGYEMSDYNIDCLNSGKFLFPLYNKTKDIRYRKAADLLAIQLKSHPRTSEGGFWHKKRYSNQMWLDGLYMGAPFYALYAANTKQPDLFDDIANQFIVIHRHTFNKEFGLNYHGWDEKKTQKWADPLTGCSPNFWGRAEGWYAMALVDVLELLPLEHPKRQIVLDIYRDVCAGIVKWQDNESGLWYQVLDQNKRAGNYLEATASAMFTYALLKGVRLGYLSEDFKKPAFNAFNGICNRLIKKNEDGTISLTFCCSVAGLGGDPYRDGSYSYYIGEPVRDNDPKGVGPFIMAGIEYSKQK